MITLLSQEDRHPKIKKNGKAGVLSTVLHLSPAKSSGYQVCPMASKGCEAACLNYAGFQYQKKYDARIKRTKWFFEDRPAFMAKLAKEIERLTRRAERENMQPGIRLNGTSDIPWESMMYGQRNLMEHFPEVHFMDYTKRSNRRDLPDNYRLTFSMSESNKEACEEAISNGMNVAVVFLEDLPERWSLGKWANMRVIDGDEHDWRYSDYDNYKERVIVGLRAKGAKARADETGFIVRDHAA